MQGINRFLYSQKFIAFFAAKNLKEEQDISASSCYIFPAPFFFVFRRDRAPETDVRAVKNDRGSGLQQYPASPPNYLPCLSDRSNSVTLVPFPNPCEPRRGRRCSRLIRRTHTARPLFRNLYRHEIRRFCLLRKKEKEIVFFG